MLAHAQEIDQTLELIQTAKNQLEAESISFDPGIQVGAMIKSQRLLWHFLCSFVAWISYLLAPMI